MHANPLNSIISDLQYLVDELEALKYLIGVVPVYERPGDELSICEHIRLIQYTQDVILANMRSQNSRFLDFESLSNSYKEQRSDTQLEQKKGVQHYINKLIQARVGLLSEITNGQINIDEFTSDYFIELIKIERFIFKEMAEKVLAINDDT